MPTVIGGGIRLLSVMGLGGVLKHVIVTCTRINYSYCKVYSRILYRTVQYKLTTTVLRILFRISTRVLRSSIYDYVLYIYRILVTTYMYLDTADGR